MSKDKRRPLVDRTFLSRLTWVSLLVIVIGIFPFVVASGKNREDQEQVNWQRMEATLKGAVPYEGVNIHEPAVVVPPPEMEPCLHCHISGESTGIWTPLARWLLFGSFVGVFFLGAFRSVSVWVTRNPWRPLVSRTADWVEDRYQISEPLSKVLSKPVPRSALRWWYCLGGITAALFGIQAVTGILLAFYYQPTPEGAYASILFIENEVRFGAGIRAVHHWSANGMIVVCVAHMLRVFIMGAYKNPRELNWVSGALLLMITVFFGFTGYLLPWDQRAYWATTVGTDIGGGLPVVGELVLVYLRVGWDVTAQTLNRFYALHIILLPIFTLIFMVLHFLMVRRLGIARPI